MFLVFTMNEYKLNYFATERAVASGELKSTIPFGDLVRKYSNLIEYAPENWPGAILRLRRPYSSMITFFESGKFTINSHNKNDIRNSARRIKRMLEDDFQTKVSIKYEIKNIMGSGILNAGLECGLLRSIFPDSKISLGGSLRIFLDEGENVAIFPSGRIVATGFDSEYMMKEKIGELVNKINANLEKAKEEKAGYCAIERAEPLIRSYYDYVKKAEELGRGIAFTEAERLEGRNHLETFLKRKAEEKNNLGVTLESLAAGELYILSILTDKKLTQTDVARITDRTEVSVRNGFRILANTIKDLFPFRIL
jgi:transcription initiation factor TFIID TATA-box-binding protein